MKQSAPVSDERPVWFVYTGMNMIPVTGNVRTKTAGM